MELYFAYGSNLKLKQITSRCPSTQTIGEAILHEHKLTFPIKSDRWGSAGVAGFIEDSSEQTHGVLYEMSKDDLNKLDEIEGYYANEEERIYTRTEISVQLLNDDIINCWTYIIPVPSPGFPFSPSAEYIDTIIYGAKEHELCPKYIEHLEGWKEY